MHCLRLAFLVVCAVSAVATSPAILAEDALSTRRAQLAANLRAHVEFLARDELSGRDSGEPGLEVAAEYIAGVFARHGLEPAGDNGTYFQHFSVPAGAAFCDEPGVSVLAAGGEEAQWTAGAEVEAIAFGAPGIVDGTVVFAGYGITTGDKEHQRDLKYDDYAGLDVRGKVLVLFRYVPRHAEGEEGVFRGRSSPHAPLVAKLEKAKALGAAGVIFVTPPGADEEDFYGLAYRASPRQRTLPAVIARRHAVEGMLAAQGRDLGAIARRIDETLAPQSFELANLKVRFSTCRSHLRLRNVCGRLPGADAKLAGESVLIGAHYDHIGRFGGQVAAKNVGKIHNGADDNASGTAGLLELAAAVAQGARPRRSTTFVAFSGEEIGLLGSRRWLTAPRELVTRNTTRVLASARPAAPGGGSGEAAKGGFLVWETGTRVRATGRFEGEMLEVKRSSGAGGWVDAGDLRQVSGPEPAHRVVTMINLDMIGRAKPDAAISVLGVQTSAGFKGILDELAKEAGVTINTAASGLVGGGSDHAHFLQRGVPVVFFFTGMHRQYNTPDDDPETLNYEGEAALLGLVDTFLHKVASSDEAPRFQPLAAAPGEATRRPQLGIRADSEFGGPGVRVVETVEDSVASKAGVKEGDVIVRLGAKVIASLADLQAALADGAHGAIELVVRRDGAETVLRAELAAPRGGFGVRFGSMPDYSWAEKGVRFEDIAPGTPAAQAGVRSGDVLVRWGGKDVDGVEQWTALLREHKPGDEVEIQVRRGTELVTLKVKLEAR